MSTVTGSAASGDDWVPVRRVRAYEEVIAQIEERILDGSLRVGQRLPAERDLADALGVSRAGVREALRALEAMGIVDAGVGSGPDAGSTIAARTTPALSTLLRLHMSLSDVELEDLVDVRVQLERSAARAAAARASAADIGQLREFVDAMRRSSVTGERFGALATEFHLAVVRISGNALTADLMHALRDAMHNQLTAQASKRTGEAAGDLIAVHDAIVDAIEREDGDEAAKLIGEHVTTP